MILNFVKKDLFYLIFNDKIVSLSKKNESFINFFLNKLYNFYSKVFYIR